MKVDVLSKTTPAADRWYTAGIAALALLTASLGLLYLPRHLLDFSPKPAAAAGGRAAVWLLSERIPGLVRSATTHTLRGAVSLSDMPQQSQGSSRCCRAVQPVSNTESYSHS